MELEAAGFSCESPTSSCHIQYEKGSCSERVFYFSQLGCSDLTRRHYVLRIAYVLGFFLINLFTVSTSVGDRLTSKYCRSVPGL